MALNDKQKRSRSQNSDKSSGKRGRVENLKPFQPGVSGNPGGRPKKKPITELYEKLANDGEFMAQMEASIKKRLLSDRMVGQIQLNDMTERVEGKLSTPLRVDGEIKVSLADVIQKARERAQKK